MQNIIDIRVAFIAGCPDHMLKSVHWKTIPFSRNMAKTRPTIRLQKEKTATISPCTER
jgi:hypothetical protein